MEATDGAGIASMNNVVKRRRSNTIRRPRSDSYSILESLDISSSSRTPPSANASKSSSGDDSPSFSRKELNLNDPASTRFISGRAGGETLTKRSKNDEYLYDDFASYYRDGNSKGSTTTDFKRSSEGVLAPANWKISTRKNTDFHGSVGLANGSNEEALPIDKVPKKVTLKLKGVARTIQTTAKPDSASGSLSSKPSRTTDGSRPRYKGNSDDDPSLLNKQSGSMATPWKEFSRSGAGLKDSSIGKVPMQSGSMRQADKSLEPVRKSKRVPKRRILDGAFDEDEEDEELRYLGRLKTAKLSYNDGIRNEDGKDGKKRKLSEIEMDNIDRCDVEDYESYRKTKDGKKLQPGKDSEDTDYNEDEDDDDDIGTDDGTDQKRKKPKKESLDSLSNGKKGALTTRQRALQSGRDASSAGAGLIEFPDGLPLPPRRKQKEQLSEEQQLKKAEAAQRRKMQVEKANRESQAEAIRKILGQDSNRKKREDKARKRRDEIAQEKAANAATVAANTVRWVMGPAGTVVTFPEEMGLPSIFSSKPCSYPPPREKCAGPSCTNPYKYRDSKSNLPLCSLECYRSINGLNRPVTTA